MNYIYKIYEILKNSGCVNKSTFGIVDSLELKYVEDIMRYIPHSKYKNIYDFVRYSSYTEGTTLSAVFQDAAEHDVLKFKPYVTLNKNNIPMLVLKYNRYVHLYKGYYYKVSYTSDTKGTYQNASVRLDEMFAQFKYSLRNTKLFQVLAYMNLIEACKGIECFDKLLADSSDVVDYFFRESFMYWYNIPTTLKYKDIVGEIVSSTDSVSDFGNKIFRLPASNTRDYARVYCHDDCTLTICIMSNNSPQYLKFTLPAVEITEDIIDEFGYENEFEMNKYLRAYVYNNPSVRAQFVTFALNYIDIVINHIIFYKDGNRDNLLRRLNVCDSVDVVTLSQFIDYFKKKQNVAIIDAAY